MEARHEEEIIQFQNMMKSLKKSYDSREKMYMSKIKKLKLESELKSSELSNEIESLTRQIEILKKLKS